MAETKISLNQNELNGQDESLSELISSTTKGKKKLTQALIDKGVDVASTDTLSQLADKVDNLIINDDNRLLYGYCYDKVEWQVSNKTLDGNWGNGYTAICQFRNMSMMLWTRGTLYMIKNGNYRSLQDACNNAVATFETGLTEESTAPCIGRSENGLKLILRFNSCLNKLYVYDLDWENNTISEQGNYEITYANTANWYYNNYLSVSDSGRFLLYNHRNDSLNIYDILSNSVTNVPATDDNWTYYFYNFNKVWISEKDSCLYALKDSGKILCTWKFTYSDSGVVMGARSSRNFNSFCPYSNNISRMFLDMDRNLIIGTFTNEYSNNRQNQSLRNQITFFAYDLISQKGISTEFKFSVEYERSNNYRQTTHLVIPGLRYGTIQLIDTHTDGVFDIIAPFADLYNIKLDLNSGKFISNVKSNEYLLAFNWGDDTSQNNQFLLFKNNNAYCFLISNFSGGYGSYKFDTNTYFNNYTTNNIKRIIGSNINIDGTVYQMKIGFTGLGDAILNIGDKFIKEGSVKETL